ncbi:tetratricopeptide repeat protein [Streptomyces sp. NPDC001356]
MTRCPEPGCPGTLTPAGFCRVSGERVDSTVGRHASMSASATVPSDPWDVLLPQESTDPTLLPEIRRRAGTPVGDAPDVLSGTVLGDQYELVGPLGHGGVGQIYLARDRRVERDVVVKYLRPEQVGNLRNAMDEERRTLRDLHHDGILDVINFGKHEGVGDYLVLPYLTGPNLEEVRALAQRRPAAFGDARFQEFVLAYGIRALSALAYLHAPEHNKVYGDLKPQNLMHEHATLMVIDVGSIRAEGAPGVTTDRFRAPDVPQETGETTSRDDLYSLGETLRSICGLGDKTQDLQEIGALDPLPPEGAAGGTTAGPASALRADVAMRMTAPAPKDLGLVSLARVLHRATRARRADRFATAQEMDYQLRGVFRELRSLRTGLETFEPSPLFWQSPHALAGALGTASALPRAAEQPAGGAPPAHLCAPPSSAEVAQHLPVPRPDPQDANYSALSRLSDDDPASLLQRTDDWDDSPEIFLLRCRLRMRVALRARQQAADDATGGPAAAPGPGIPDLAEAEGELAQAEAAIGPEHAPHDWRLDWHRGLLAVARDDVRAAWGHFDDVYAAIPGEYAPKLALGCCAELLGAWSEAQRFHEAVRVRNPSLGGAAFGVARAWLAREDRAGLPSAIDTLDGGRAPHEKAIDALDAVPQHSPHRTAARVAAVRIAAGMARDARGLDAVLGRLSQLFYGQGLLDEDVGVRVKAEVWEVAQRLVDEGGISPAELRTLAAGAGAARIDFPADERQLRTDLSAFYVRLAHQAARAGGPNGTENAEELLDRAYRVRPLVLRHNGNGPWLGRRIISWLRSITPARPGSRRPRSPSR